VTHHYHRCNATKERLSDKSRCSAQSEIVLSNADFRTGSHAAPSDIEPRAAPCDIEPRAAPCDIEPRAAPSATPSKITSTRRSLSPLSILCPVTVTDTVLIKHCTYRDELQLLDRAESDSGDRMIQDDRSLQDQKISKIQAVLEDQGVSKDQAVSKDQGILEVKGVLEDNGLTGEKENYPPDPTYPPNSLLSTYSTPNYATSPDPRLVLTGRTDTDLYAAHSRQESDPHPARRVHNLPLAAHSRQESDPHPACGLHNPPLAAHSKQGSDPHPARRVHNPPLAAHSKQGSDAYPARGLHNPTLVHSPVSPYYYHPYIDPIR
jgi:hypothetical protein